MKKSKKFIDRGVMLLAIPTVFAMLFLGALLKERSETSTSKSPMQTSIPIDVETSSKGTFQWGQKFNKNHIKGMSIIGQQPILPFTYR